MSHAGEHASSSAERVAAASSVGLSATRALAVSAVALLCGAFAMYGVSLSVGKASWPWWMQIPIQTAGLVTLGAGVFKMVRQPRLTFASPLLVLFGLTWYIGDLQFSDNSMLYAIGFCLFFVNAAVMAHIVLSFPSGRLRDPLATLVIVSLYAIILVTQTLRSMGANQLDVNMDGVHVHTPDTSRRLTACGGSTVLGQCVAHHQRPRASG